MGPPMTPMPMNASRAMPTQPIAACGVSGPDVKLKKLKVAMALPRTLNFGRVRRGVEGLDKRFRVAFMSARVAQQAACRTVKTSPALFRPRGLVLGVGAYPAEVLPALASGSYVLP